MRLPGRLQATLQRLGHHHHARTAAQGDRKSTRLNSSHTVISYAVFCLKTEKDTSALQSHSHLVCRLLLEKEAGQFPWTRAQKSPRGSAPADCDGWSPRHAS